MKKKSYSVLKRKGYLWVTLILFLVSISLHWLFGWEAYKNEQNDLGLPVVAKDYEIEMMRDTMENWQSEFLQLIWQVAGLAFLWYVGSPQSKEGDERLEAKLDHILQQLDPEKAKQVINALEEKFPKE